MKDFYVSDAARYENKQITSYFAVANKQVRTKRENGAYLALTLGDKTGQLDARMWENFEKSVEGFDNGDIVKVQALVCRFAEKLQLKVDKIRRADAEEYTLADFVPHTARDIDELWSELKGFVASFTDPHLLKLVNSFLDDPVCAEQLRQAPAAKSMHHAFIGGLLEHVVSMLGLCDLVAKHYTGIHRDLLLTGAIFHDIGKLSELSWGTSFDYTMEGQLLGHITIGIGVLDRRIAEIPDFPDRLRILVQHVVLSHHGKYEFGSPKLPMIREAILLNYLDDMDAKMQTFDAELKRAAESGRDPAGMTEWVRAMDRPLLSTAHYLSGDAPKPEAETAEIESEKEEEQHALPLED